MDQFWTELAQAHTKVSNDKSLEITIARGGYEAKVKSVGFDDVDAVAILITPKDTESKQAFIVPGGE